MRYGCSKLKKPKKYAIFMSFFNHLNKDISNY